MSSTLYYFFVALGGNFLAHLFDGFDGQYFEWLKEWWALPVLLAVAVLIWVFRKADVDDSAYAEDDDGTMHVLSKLDCLLVPEAPQLEGYLRSCLDSFFSLKRNIAMRFEEEKRNAGLGTD